MSHPFVSVVIPARNEERTIEACLRSIFDQDWPAAAMEVIVADGMSTDSTRRIVAELSRRDPRLRLIDNEGRIVPTAMNRAIEAARGDLIVRVDGHTLIQPDYVRTVVETLQRTGAQGAGGGMTPLVTADFAGAVALATSNPVGMGNSTFHYAAAERDADSVYLGAYPRRTFEQFGGYDEAMVRNQDDELNYRIRAGGGRIVLNPAIRSAYHPRGSASRLFSQYFQYGWWKSRVMRRIPSSASPRHLIPSLFVLALITLLAASARWPAAATALGVLLALHVVASLAGALLWAPRGWRELPLAGRLKSLALAPVATFLLHLGYGIGLIAGLPSLVLSSSGSHESQPPRPRPLQPRAQASDRR